MQSLGTRFCKILRGHCEVCGHEYQINEHEAKRFSFKNGKMIATEHCHKCNAGNVILNQLWGG